MAWKITHDILSPKGSYYEDDNREGLGSKAALEGETFSARLLDDDLEHYYTISFDRSAWMDELEGVWNWAMNDSGAVHLCVSLETLERLGESEQSMALYRDKIAFTKGPHKGYCTLFA